MQSDAVNFVDPSGLEPCPAGTIEVPDAATGGSGCVPSPTGIVNIDISDEIPAASDYPSLHGFRPMLLPIPREVSVPQDGRPQEPKDPDTNAVNAALGACSTGASIGQYSNVNPAGTAWRGGVNGQWSRMGWAGNGSTGARSAAVGRASSFSLLSKSVGTAGAGFSLYQSGHAFHQGDYKQGAKGIADTGLGLPARSEAPGAQRLQVSGLALTCLTMLAQVSR